MNYDYYIGVDWSKDIMAIAHSHRDESDYHIYEGPTDIKGLKLMMRKLPGRKILTAEECNWAQWLYTELSPEVEKVVICDPYRNSLIMDGAKTDKIDAQKLCHLLRAGFLKPVFHTTDDFITLRKLVSAYDDLVKAGSRMKCERDALFRAQGKNIKNHELSGTHERFVLKMLNERITISDQQRYQYRKQFERLCKTNKFIRAVHSVPGLGFVGACKAAAIVVDPARFKTKGQFLSYCGLVVHQKMSGGKSYGYRRVRCNRALKSVFKTAAVSIFLHRGPFWDYYQKKLEQGLAPHNARNAVARKIAISTLGIMKQGEAFDKQKLNLS